VIFHGVQKKIISDQGFVFTGCFWTNFQATLGMQLNFGTTDHPKTDGKMERTNPILEYTLQMYVIDQQK